jgi:hypothetical protein
MSQLNVDDSDTSSDVSIEKLSPKKPSPSSVLETIIQPTALTKTADSEKKKQLPDVILNFDFLDFSKYVKKSVMDERKNKTGDYVDIIEELILEGQREGYPLKKLTTMQMRNLCKLAGVPSCGSRTKFECQMFIANYITYGGDKTSNKLLKTSKYATCLTNKTCRLVNVVFHESFIENFKTVNDIKNRKDHETANTYKNFWIEATTAYNSCIGFNINEYPKTPAKLVENTTINGNKDIGLESRFTIIDLSSMCESVDDCFTTIVNVSNNDHITEELTEDTSINLIEVDRLDVDVFRKKILNLFKIRTIMKKHMTASGTHDSDAWNFVEGAMKTFTGFTKVGIFYFWTRCEENPDVDANFITFMDESLKCDSTSPFSPEVAPAKKRGREEKSVQDFQANNLEIINLLKDSAKDRKVAALDRKAAIKKQEKDRKFELMIKCCEITKNFTEVEKIMKEMMDDGKDDEKDDDSE